MASPFPIYLQVWLGKTTPTKAPASLMQALVQAEVEQGDKAPCGFQLVFQSAFDGAKNDYPLVDSPLLAPFNRAALAAIVGNKTQLLIDGYITNTELDPASGNVTVTGEDVSVKMDLFQMVVEYPKLKDSVIVNDILSKYRVLKMTPKVVAPKNEIAPTDSTPTQRSTDRAYVQRLAEKNDALFYVQPGKSLNQNTAYWGPAVRKGAPQKAISARSGAVYGDVEQFSVSFDSLAQEMSYGEKMTAGGQGKESKEARYAASDFQEVKLAEDSPKLKQFAQLAAAPEKARSKLNKLAVRGKYLYQLGLQPGAADLAAQGATDSSTGGAVTLTGTLDAVNYGAVLQAPGLVGLRAAGKAYSGIYYVKKVKHSFKLRRTEMQYTQAFTLTREGLGSTKDKV